MWKEVISQQEIRPENKRMVISKKNGKEIIHYYSWINEINYHGHLLNWFECTEHAGKEEKRFVYVSNLKIDYNNVIEMTSSGRMRWNIENEGLNILKNNGYGLQHKYSRMSMQATKNFYQCMLIAHLLNQLLQLSPFIQSLLYGKQTIKNLWEQLISYICIGYINKEKLKEFINTRRQFRYG